jgi:hypothetical protein
VAGLQSDIPKRSHEGGDRIFTAGVDLIGQEQHDINVRAGMQFASPIAANRDQRRTKGLKVLPPKLYQDAIEECGPRVDEFNDGLTGLKAGAQPRASSYQRFANITITH